MRKLTGVGVASLLALGLGALTAQAAPPATPQGMITAREFEADGGGTTVANVTNDVNFPNNPWLVYHPPYFESWATGDINVLPTGDAGESYGDQLLGYFYPPTSGDYTFYIASDDNSALYLSTDSTAANKHLIAQVGNWANRRDYANEDGTPANTPEMDSATFTGTQWPVTNGVGATITLVAGQAYYIEALHKEGGGGDDVSVSIDGTLPIPGSMLSSIDVPGGPPTVASITSSPLAKSVTVVFSEPLDAVSATTLGNYALDNGVTITSATLAASSGEGDSNTVVLATSAQPASTTFTLTINNVKDVSANTIVANTKAMFKSYVFVPGWATYEQWTADVISTTPGDLDTNLLDGLENLPTFTAVEPKFDGQWADDGTEWNDLASVMYAWFTAPTDGAYVFYLSSDDASDLFLSTDAAPANKKLIAQEVGYSNEYAWQTVGGNGSVASDKRSDTFSASAWPTPNVITLTNGQTYYIEIDHVQGTGGNGAGATFTLPGDTNPPAESATGELLVGNVIGTYLDTSGASVTINTQPANIGVVEGFTASFSVNATGVSAYIKRVFYQWQTAPSGSSTFSNIPGATGTGYTTGILGLSDSGTQFRVVISVPGVSQTSAIASVTVTADVTPPKVLSAGSLQNQLAATEIGVIFDKVLNAGSATTLINYSLDNGATISAARYVPNSSGMVAITPDVPGGVRGANNQTGVILTVSSLVPADTYHLTVAGVKDGYGNTLSPATNVTVSLSPFTWVSLGETITNAGNPDGATNEAISVGTNSWNLVNGGNAFWGTEDDITMVYETVKGDFDRTVQVDWNDFSSHWARCGLAARASVDPADQFGPTVPEYQAVLSDPETNAVYGSIPNSPANDQYETNRRLDTGDATTGNNSEGNPHYPASYVRLKRVGQLISMFYSSSTNDDKWWYPIGSTDFTAAIPALPDTLFVGPTLGVENGNIDGQDGASLEFTGTYAGRFRNYETFPQKPRGTATQAIGLNFGNGYGTAQPGSVGNNSAGTTLTASDIAGVGAVAQGTWNNIFGFDTNSTGIVEENETTGATNMTTMSVTSVGCPNLWSTQGPGADANQDGGQMTGMDAVLMTGYLDSGGASATDVAITNVPPGMVSAGYDVVVYSMGAVDSRGGGFAILDPDNTNAVVEGYYTMQAPLNPTGLVQAMPDPPSLTPTSWAVGNFLVFTNLKMANLIVEASTVAPYGFSGTPRAELNAIQLVSPSGLISGMVVPPRPTISISKAGVITYTGVLRSASSLAGPWTIVSAATSPYTVPTSGGTVFYAASNQ